MKIGLSPLFLLMSIVLLFWTIVLTAIFGEMPPLISLLAVVSLLMAIYAEIYAANRRQP